MTTQLLPCKKCRATPSCYETADPVRDLRFMAFCGTPHCLVAPAAATREAAVAGWNWECGDAPAPYICPQCGPDANGGDVHSLTHHRLPPMTPEEAVQCLYGSRPTRMNPVLGAPYGGSVYDNIDLHAVSMPVLDTFIFSALKELGQDPFLVLPENRLRDMATIMRSIQTLMKAAGPQKAVAYYQGSLSYPVSLFVEHSAPMKRSADEQLDKAKAFLTDLSLHQALASARQEGRDPKRFDLKIALVLE